MLQHLSFSIAICLLFFTSAVSAQSDDPETFPVEQRRIPEPTQPPDDWTYPGMILMSGYAGIHAMQADWETPHVVAQFTMDQQGNVPIDGGQLSPDGNWYAAPIGEVYHSESFNNFWIVRGLEVYSLLGDSESFALDLTDYQEALSGWSAWGFSPVEWQDDSSLILGELFIHPFANSVETSPLNFIDSMSQYNQRIVSPDKTRAYGGVTPFLEEAAPGLHDLTNLTTVIDLGVLDNLSWRPDSVGFIAEIQAEERDWHGLVYYDRNGSMIAQVLEFDSYKDGTTRRVSGRSELQWSPDSRYFAAVVDESSRPKNLVLVDTHEQKVLDTCLPLLNAPIWSPDGTMFAYLTEARENLNLVIVDTKIWQAYIVAWHSGARTFLFDEPEMVGWRSTTNDP